MATTRRVTLSLLFTVVLIFGATKAHALLWNHLYQYYSDCAFTNLVGEEFYTGTHCPDDVGYSWGITCDYRKITTIQECGTTSGGGSVCAQYVNGAWQPITCP